MEMKTIIPYRTTLFTLCLLLGMLTGVHALDIEVNSRVILTVDDPTVTATISPQAPKAGDEVTLTLENLTNKTATVTAHQATADGTTVDVTGNSPTYTFTMPAGEKVTVYVNVAITKDTNATYAVTTKAVGVAASLLTVTGADSPVKAGTSVTISATASSQVPANTTVTVTSFTALSADGTFVAEGADGLTFNMPHSPVEVTIAAKSTVKPTDDPAPDENTQDPVTVPVVTIPEASLPDEVDDLSTLSLEVTPTQAETTEEKAVVEEMNDLLSAPEGEAPVVLVLDITLQKTDASGSTEVQPAGTITITLPYPEGTTKDGTFFRILHLKSDGTTETIIPRRLTAGLQFEVSSLSPFFLGYTTRTAVTGLSLNKTVLSLEVGTSETLTATVAPADASDPSVSWDSTAPTVATVDATGKVAAVKKGTATITATSVDDNSKTASCAVTVTKTETPDPPTPPSVDHVTGVSLDRTSATLKIGGEFPLTATIRPWYADDPSVGWKSSDPTVATVDADGKVKALKAGTATITVTTRDGGFTATCLVTVEEDTPTAIETIDNSLRIRTADGTLCIDSPQPADVAVYTAAGSLKYIGKGQPSYRISLAPGFYLVRVNDKTYKITL